MKKLLSALLCSVLVVALHAQCSMSEIPLTQRANASDLIVEGKVVSKNSFWNSNHTMIYTANTIELYKVFKGTISSPSIEVITEGGIVGMDRIDVDPSLRLTVDDIGVFTCANVTHVKASIPYTGVPQYEAYAAAQGFVKYNLDTRNAADAFRTYQNIETEIYDVVLSPAKRQYDEIEHFNINESTQRFNNNQAQSVSISGFSPTTITAGTGTVLTINGSGFGASQGSGTVGFKNADDGGATYITVLPTQIQSWSNTQITVEVPSNAGTGTIQVTQGTTSTSAGTLTISYAHLNVDFDPGSGTVAYQTDHVDDNGSGGYTWQMNTAFDANTLARASFMRAFDSWRCNTGINWTIGANTSVNDAVSDGTNCICFDNTSPLPSGVLGVCYSYWSGCASGPTIVWYVNELDIIFDEGSNITPLTWQYGPGSPTSSQYDFETVAVHELGHGHQLGHVINPGAIMHYAISNGASNRTPGVNDLAGANFVQAKSVVANVCGPGAMVAYSCTTAPVAAFSGGPTILCAGGTVSYVDMSTNTPTSWSWVFQGGTPSTSTLQNPTNITYSTPGTYDVSLTATNAAGSDVVTSVGYITVTNCSAPVASFSGSPTTICAGNNVSFTDNSTNNPTSWSWTFTGGTPSTSSLQNPVINYATPGNYAVSLTATNANGSDVSTVSGYITVNALPSVSFTSNPVSQTVCLGFPVTLSGTGATSYVWTGGINDGISFVPGNTASYTVTGTDANGCQNTAIATITVNSPPNLSVTSNPANGIICNGSQATLTATGATSYSWTGGITNGVPFAPSATTSYTVTGTASNGCQNTATATITVNNCSGPTATVPCGNTYSKKINTVSASNVVGAVNYKFSFYNNATNTLVAQRIQPSRTLTLNNVSGLYYNTTYKWTVAVDVGSGYGAESSMGCTITLGIPSSTVPCGSTYSNLNTYTAVANPGGILNYRFKFYDNVTNALITQVTQSSNYIYFNQVPGLNYGNTYKWTVAVEYPLSSGGSTFGPESSMSCPITFSAPQTTVPCGHTYNRNSGYTVATGAQGATGYRFSFYQSNVLVAQRAQTSNYIYFSMVSGISNGQSYTWTVEVQYNNGSQLVYGPPSTPCAISFSSSAMSPLNNLETQRLAEEQIDTTRMDVDPILMVYPNPTTDRITISSNETIHNVYVYTIAGELVKTFENGTDISLGDLSTGTYFLFVQTDSGMKRSIVVKQ